MVSDFFSENKKVVLIIGSVIFLLVFLIIILLIFGSKADPAEINDARRKTDLDNIKVALEDCFLENQAYDADIYSNKSCTSSRFSNKKVPTDPKTGENYEYFSIGYPATGFTIKAKMEKLKSIGDVDINGTLVIKGQH